MSTLVTMPRVAVVAAFAQRLGSGSVCNGHDEQCLLASRGSNHKHQGPSVLRPKLN